MANVEDVAEIIINYMNAEEEPHITNLMLNKLLYFAQGHCLAEIGKPLFEDDFEAWDYGPVIPKIYHKYKVCGKHNIFPTENVNEVEVLDNERYSLLGSVLEQYGDFSSSRLVDLTHEIGSPWDKARIKNNNRHSVIPKESIKEYFETVELEDYDEDEYFSEDALKTIDEYKRSVQENSPVIYPLKKVG